jgi:toxin ParE1/3/4
VPEGHSIGLQVQLTRTAQRDVIAILNLSRQEFGESAAGRYQALIKQAAIDIGDNPVRPGSQERPDLMIEGARTYHLSFSRNRVTGHRVKEPRHFLLYRLREDGVIEVARILRPKSVQWDLNRNWSAIAVRDANGLLGIDIGNGSTSARAGLRGKTLRL